MRLSNYFLPILFEKPKEAVTRSHELMLKAGLIKRLASGIYSYMPLSVRVLNKIIKIIKEELERIGALEVVLPSLQPKSIWEMTGRWEEYGDDMFKLKDRKGADWGLGPTHEEVITLIVKEHVKSYKQLPTILYQIQPKFRDEPRPRFGTIRCREFLMKDAYSFHTTEDSLEETYKAMYDAYCRIFSRCGLKFKVVEAETGLIGGAESHEFMAQAEAGEDIMVSCNTCEYMANQEKAEIGLGHLQQEKEELLPLELVYTPNKSSVEEVAEYLGISPSKLAKTLIYHTEKGEIACMIKGDTKLNETKLKKVLSVKEVTLADSALIEEITKGPVGFTGPIGLEIPIIADISLKSSNNLIIGANKLNYHYKNANINRDFKITGFYDICLAEDNYPCPRCNKGLLRLERCIELGHIFKLGTKYSKAMGGVYINEYGQEMPYIMGCYGIGVSRIIPAYIEQNNDASGIIWNANICPYQIIILVLDKSQAEKLKLAEELYSILQQEKLEVVLDDREETAGRKFYDADLLGFPIQIVIGKKANKDNIEICLRRDKKRIFTNFNELPGLAKDLLLTLN
jgi:prolyl-tRNA synthetase